MSWVEHAECIEILVGRTGGKGTLEDSGAGAEGGQAYSCASDLIIQKWSLSV
jgi:hypothetical protein